MKLGDIKDVLTFSSFRPEPDDRRFPWSRRFVRERTLLLNIGRARTSWKSVGKGGRLLDGGVQYGEFKEIAPRMAEEWRSLTDDGWCAVSLNTRYVISLETNVSRKAGVEELIRSNPRMVLGARYEKGKRYAFVNNPESVSTVLLTVDEEQIKVLEGQLKAAGLKTGRISCGPFAMLRRLLETVHATPPKTGKETVDGRQTSFLDIVCCEGSTCAMVEAGNLWTDLRSRSDLYKEDDLNPIFEILQPLITRINESGTIRFMGDTIDSPILAALRNQHPAVTFSDYSTPDHFWRLMADL